MGWIMIGINLLGLYYVAKLVDGSDLLETLGTDYFSFLITGIIPIMLLNTAMGAMVADIRMGQVTGTLEAVLTLPVSLPKLLTATALSSFAFAGARILLFITIGTLIFGFDLSQLHPLKALTLLAVTALAFSGIGLTLAAATLAFKQNSSFQKLITIGFLLLGGVFFPIELLPLPIQAFSHYLPITCATSGLRLALQEGCTWNDLRFMLCALGVFSTFVLPASIVFFIWALNKARRTGSLGQF